MRLVHPFSMTLLVSALASVSACSSDPEPLPDGTGGTGMSGSGGSATGGSAGSATGGSAGSATGGSATGGSAGTGTGGSGGGAAGSGTSGSGGGGMMDFPSDSSQAGIEAFLMGESYKTTGMGWRPETMAGDGVTPPHLAAMRYFNETLIASKAAGNQPPAMQHTTGSMAVKEILEGTTVIGKAAMLRTMTNWVYYCTATIEGRCYTGSPANMVYYAAGTAGSCACHSQGIMPSWDAIP